jgi:hypothetical protein
LRSLRAVLLYSVLTTAFTWPLPSLLHVTEAGDAGFFAWTVGWELHALRTDVRRLPHANIFHPLRFTLGLDEPVLGTTALVLPFAPFTSDGVLLFNLARLLTFVVSALTAYWLARELGASEAASLLAGAAFAFSPIRTDQLAHLSTLGTQWLPLVLLFLHRLARTGAVRDAALAGLFFALSTLACGYHGVIGVAVLPLFALVLFWRRWPRPLALAAGPLVAGALLLPLYLLHRAALRPLGFDRGSAETILYSAGLETFFAASARNRVWGALTGELRGLPNDLFPGLVPVVLVALAFLLLWRRKQAPGRDAVALAVLLAAAVLVALGPEVRLFGRPLFPGPFALLRELPLFRMIRVPARAGVFIALPLALLLAKAVDALPALRGARLCVLALLVLAETVIAPIEVPGWTRVVDTRQAPPEVGTWLAAQPPGTPIVELPMLGIEAVFEQPACHDSVYMVRSLAHFQPLANGYAGVDPPAALKLRELARSFPAPAFLDALRALGVRFVVLHGACYGPNRRARVEAGLAAAPPGLSEVARFGPDRVFLLH